MSTPLDRASPASSSIPSLDGIRGLAVSLVFMAHTVPGQLIPGGLGVTVFFVLSGYLITTLFRSEYHRTGAIDLRAFYLRRLLRLMPPLLVVVTATSLLSAMSLVQGRFTKTGLLSVLFYFGNYFDIATDFHGIPAGLGVIWSLAVEEHFYLLYPPLAIGLLAIGNRRLSAAALSILCVLILLRRCWLVSHGATEAYISMATDTRVDAILVGCFMGLLLDPGPAVPPVSRPARDWAIAISCVAVLVGSLLIRDTWFRSTLRYTLQSIAIAPLIFLSVEHPRHFAFRWLNTKPMIYLGAISYSVYLSHQVIFYTLTTHLPDLNWTALVLLSAATTLVVAASINRWVERPSQVLRRRLHREAQQPFATPVAGIAP